MPEVWHAMTSTQIRVGDWITLKRNNPYGFQAEPLHVLEVVKKPGYKTPWLRCEGAKGSDISGMFRPSDFQRQT